MPSPASALPTVSIGLPVYNGANHLRDALDSLLAQDFPDFELIISDNGSDDSTESICREYAARDSRIRYIRHAQNRGSPWNFAFVAREARAEFFMWAAHDDLWHLSYIRRCLVELRAHPTAVLCCTEINFIDTSGHPLPAWDHYRNIGTLGLTPVQRIHEIFIRMGWFAWYGLMRRDATLKLSLGLSVIGFDVILLAELLLLGDFARVDDRLFTFRLIPRTTTDYARTMNLQSPPTSAPYSHLAAAILATVHRSALSPAEKSQILADSILTLTSYNPSWRREISLELLGPAASPTDPQFTALLTSFLANPQF